MESYICNNVFIPLRLAPSHKSEMESQLLFGEKFIITDNILNWVKVESLLDKCEGWINTDHEKLEICTETSKPYTLTKRLTIYKDDHTSLNIEAGSDIYNPTFLTKQLGINGKIYRTVSEFDESYITPNDSITNTAMSFLNTPYLFGGRCALGIDCSGLTQLVFKIHGKSIPRNGYKQVDLGREVSFIDDAEPGDLAFFDKGDGKIAHVGMIISKGLVIHASGRVRIDSVDHQGIFRHDLGKYTHHLRTVKRLL